MNYHEFIGQVQARARLGSTGEAVRATRAILEVLGQRLFGGEAEDLILCSRPAVKERWTGMIEESAI